MMSKMMMAVMVAAAAFVTTASGQPGVPSVATTCVNKFVQACNDSQTTAGVAQCCTGVTELYSNDAAAAFRDPTM